jgi:hypothetical protein
MPQNGEAGMNRSFGQVFGGALAVILLGIYATAAGAMIFAIIDACTLSEPCTADLSGRFREGYIYVLTTVGGLVSALVVAQLSITRPGDMPSLAGFRPVSRGGRWVGGMVVVVYLVAWGLVGLASLIVGVMLYPGVLSTVSDIGTVWLGLAVSAGYAYFGIDHNGDRAQGSATRPGGDSEP